MLLLSPFSPLRKGSLQIIGEGLVEHTSIDKHTADKVGVYIARRPSILDIACTIGVSSRSRDAERCSSVANAVEKAVDRRGLMDSSQSLLVVVTIKHDVLAVLRAELVHHLMNVVHTTSAESHGLC